MSKERFAHDAFLSMEVDADDRAPGDANTVALCGNWEHEPPCPLAPHHTRVERVGDEMRLRVLFAAEPDDEPRVRSTIDDVLARGTGATPEGRTVWWRLLEAWATEVGPDEQEHAVHLARS